MENDENIINEQNHENDIPAAEEGTEITETAPEAETPSTDIEEEGNMDICPNCLEPNTENLAVCKYCGMPLHKGADPDAFVMKESEEELAANRAQATPEPPKKQKPQENGFRRIMPWLGLYLLYYGITGIFDISRQIKAAEAEGQQVNSAVAYGSQVIWIAAGLLMAWPLIKKGYRKLRHLPEEDETTEETTETETVENSENTGNELPEENPENQEVTENAPEPETSEDENSNAEAPAEASETDEIPVFPQDKLTNEDGTEEENADANWL